MPTSKNSCLLFEFNSPFGDQINTDCQMQLATGIYPQIRQWAAQGWNGVETCISVLPVSEMFIEHLVYAKH